MTTANPISKAVQSASAVMLASWPSQARHVVPNDHARSMAISISELKAEPSDVKTASERLIRQSQFLPSAAEFRTQVIKAMAERGAGPKARFSVRMLPSGQSEPLVHVLENGEWRWKSPVAAHESTQALPDAAKQGRQAGELTRAGKNDAFRDGGTGQ
jgi:hypothetical protein